MWTSFETFCNVLTPSLGAAVAWLAHHLMTWPTDTTPLAGILLAPFAALAVFAVRKIKRIGRFRYRKVLRILLSKRYFRHKSHALDLILMAGNIGLFAIICGQATISGTTIAGIVYHGITSGLGAPSPSTLDPILIGSAWALGLFLAYEFAYYFDHYLSHNIALLWEFHKVHHTAEVLSPLTNFRVHPVDSLVFVNIVALCNGIATGALHYAFGAGPVRLDFLNQTVILGLIVTVFTQLQHTHIWLPLTGAWGRLLLSPAHHQIHHSIEITHHNKNLGNLIAIFDWLFGTLHIPTKRRQKLTFGVVGEHTTAHDLNEGLLQPFKETAKLIAPLKQQTQPAL